MSLRSYCLLFAAVLAAALSAAEGEVHHTFTGPEGDAASGTWGGGTLATVDGRSVLRLAGENAQSNLRWPVPAEAAQVTVALRARARELRGLNPPKQAPKLLIALEDAASKAKSYNVIQIPPDGDWHDLHTTLNVAGITTLKLSPGLFGCSGILEVDAIAMAPGAERPALPADPQVRAVPKIDGNWIDVTIPPFNADPSGRRDSTEDLQLAFAAARRTREGEHFAGGVITVFPSRNVPDVRFLELRPWNSAPSACGGCRRGCH